MNKSTLDTSQVKSLFSPLNFSQFCDEYWPAYHYNAHADPQRLSSLLSLPPLQSIEAMLSLHNDVQVIPPYAEKKLNERFVDSSEAKGYFDGGATLCLLNIGKSLSGINEWIGALSLELGINCRTQCNAYISPAGSGTPKHFDNHEVFVIQVLGQKDWVISANDQVDYPTINYLAGGESAPELQSYWAQPDDSLVMPAGSSSVQMNPGSVLFMPRGTWHMTQAGHDSLSLSIGLFLPNQLDIILRTLRRALVQHKDLRRPLVSIPNKSRYVEMVKDMASITFSYLENDADVKSSRAAN